MKKKNIKKIAKMVSEFIDNLINEIEMQVDDPHERFKMLHSSMISTMSTYYTNLPKITNLDEDTFFQLIEKDFNNLKILFGFRNK